MPDQITRPTRAPELAITFQYYRDMQAAARFYEQVLGLTLAIDQGWARIYRVSGAAHLGLVDETRGMQKWAAQKTSQFCLRVDDVDAWHRWVSAQEVTGLGVPRESVELGIRAFVFLDPEGYQIEVQTAKPGH